MVQPGETLSYWKLIGRPTYRKGYLDGVLLKNGTVQYGCGGGCVSCPILIFWMTLHTPLEVKEASPPWLRRLSRLQPDPALWERSHLLLSLRRPDDL